MAGTLPPWRPPRRNLSVVAAAPTPIVSPVERHSGSRIDWGPAFWYPPDVADEWLIEPVLARGRGHSIYAPAKAGKSLFVLSIMAAAASGGAVLRRPAGPPLRCLYLDHEMTPDDLRERLGDMGYGPDSNMEALVYHSLPTMAPLDTAEGGADVLALAVAHSADIVVIDTLSRVIRGEEDKADTIRALYRHTGGPLKAAGIATLRIDHAGKDAERGERGSSAKREDLDVIWRLVPKESGRYELKATPPARMGWVPGSVRLEQTDAPLSYRLVDETWPAGTKETADLLDQLEVPLAYGKEKARSAIRDAGRKAPRNETLMAAMRWRRSKASDKAEVEA